MVGKIFSILLILLLCAFGVAYSMDIPPEEFDNYTEEGYLKKSFDYIDEFDDEFYYNQLTREEQLLYQAMYFASINYADYFTIIDEPDVNAFDNARYAFISDWPEFFWWQGECELATDSSINIVGKPYPKYKFYITEYKDFNDAEHKNKKNTLDNIDQIVTQIIEDCRDIDDYIFLRNIHDTIIQNVDYDDTNDSSHTIAGTFFERKGVCDGYSKAFKLIANRAGYECIIVYGTSTSETKTESHAWNLVKINNRWYHIDSTWDDPLKKEVDNTQVSYDYFLMSDDYMTIDHEIDSKYTYPQCKDMSWFYYNLPGTYFDTFSSVDTKDFILSQLRKGSKELRLKFLNLGDTMKAYKWLFEDGNFTDIFKSYRNNFKISYSYGYSKTSNLLTINFTYK